MSCLSAFAVCAAFSIGFGTPADAQKTKSQLTTEITTNFPDNTTGQITPSILRTTTTDIVNSLGSLFNSTVAGTSQTFTTTQAQTLVLRSNSGTAMTDTLPGTSPGPLPAGSIISVKNNDSTALYQVTAGTGATLDGLATNYVILGPSQSGIFQSDGVNYVTISKPTRVKFAALSSPTLFVNASTGSDTNSGITTSFAFQTIQAAMDILFDNYDHGGSKFTMQLAAGTYSGFSIRGGFTGHYGNPSIISPPTFTLRGDPAAAGSYIIQDSASTGPIEVVLGKSLHVDGVTLQSAAHFCAWADMTGGEIVLHTVIFNACSLGATYATRGGLMWQEGPWTIAGDSPWIIYTDQVSAFNAVANPSAPVITFSGTRTVSSFVVAASRGATVNLCTVTFAGTTPTGTRWATNYGGTIDGSSAGTPCVAGSRALNTLIPGTVNGSNLTPVAAGTGLNVSTADSGALNPTIALTVPVVVANGGTNCVAASGTCLDNITGFGTTGILQRTGAGAYTALPYTAAGSWTPTDNSGAALTFTSVSASYNRIGNVVWVGFEFIYPATGSGAAASISGLPVTIANAGYAKGACFFLATTLANGAMQIYAPNTTHFNVFNNQLSAAITNSQLSGATIEGSCIYPAT